MSEIIVAADLNHYKNDQMNRVYDPQGIAPTVLVVSGGGREIKIMERYKCLLDYRGKTKVELKPKQISPTLRAESHGNPGLIVFGDEGEEYGLKTLRVNDLFCGAGGMGIGFKQAGFETAGAWDFDKYAVQAYAHNVDSVVKQMSVLDMSWEDMPKADVWTFGFPCQDLSVAGKQAGLFEGKRSGLFFEVMRLLDEIIEANINRLPNIIMAENVKGLKPYLEVLKDEYEKRGYVMYYTLYNSKFWGLPQNRERYFVVGVHESIEKEFTFPVQQEHYIPRLSTVLEPVVDEKYYISDEKAAKIIEQAKEGLRVKQATKKGYDIAVEGDSVNLSHPNSKTRRGRVGKQVAQTLLTGQEQVVVEGLQDVHACITPDRVEKRQNGRRAKENEEEMFTVTTQDKHGIIEQTKIMNLGNINPSGRGMGGNVIHEDGISSTLTVGKSEPVKVAVEQKGYRVRKLTEREYLRLQGFPENFEIVVSASQTYKQAGNAVSVPVARTIAERIRMFLLSL